MAGEALPTNAVAADLGVTPSPVTPPAPTTPPMSYSEANDRRQRAFSDPAWRTRYFSGDVEAVREYNDVVHGLTSTPPPATGPDDAEAMVRHMRSITDLSEDVATQIRMGLTVTPNEREQVRQFWEQCLRDKGWMKRYLDGDREAVREKAMIDITLAAPVRDIQPQQKG